MDTVKVTTNEVLGIILPWPIKLSISLATSFSVGALALLVGSMFPQVQNIMAILPGWLAWWHLLSIGLFVYALPFVAVALGWRPLPIAK